MKDRLERDIRHIKDNGIDNGTLFKRVERFMRELKHYRDSGLTAKQVRRQAANHRLV